MGFGSLPASRRSHRRLAALPHIPCRSTPLQAISRPRATHLHTRGPRPSWSSRAMNGIAYPVPPTGARAAVPSGETTPSCCRARCAPPDTDLVFDPGQTARPVAWPAGGSWMKSWSDARRSCHFRPHHSSSSSPSAQDRPTGRHFCAGVRSTASAEHCKEKCRRSALERMTSFCLLLFASFASLMH